MGVRNKGKSLSRLSGRLAFERPALGNGRSCRARGWNGSLPEVEKVKVSLRAPEWSRGCRKRAEGTSACPLLRPMAIFQGAPLTSTSTIMILDLCI